VEQVGLGDACAGVGNRNEDAGAIGRDMILCGNKDATAFGHGLAGIDDEVLDDLADLTSVGVGCPQLRIEIEVALDGCAVESEPGHFDDQVGDIGGGEDWLATSGERQQLLSQGSGPLGCQPSLIKAGRTAGGIVVDLHDREIANNDCEDVIEVMGNAAGEETDRLELGGAIKLSGDALLLSDIANDDDGSGDLALPFS
jgi:hypothetical protein